MASKAALVDQIKGMQRADPDAKQAWWDYCDQHLQGIKDPNRHEADTLQGFVSSYQSGGGGGGGRRPSRPAAAPAFYGGAPGVAAAWGPYAMASPAAFGKGGDAGFGTLAEAVKMGQRKSQNWKACWQAYVALYGSGFNDPNKYDDGFISGFLDYLGQLGNSDLGAAAAEQGINLEAAIAGGGGKGGPPTPVGGKRPLGSAGGMPPAKRPAVGGYGGNSEVKETLVAKIKALQRSDPSAKEAWQKFCEERTQGVKDPNRHDEGVLSEFLAGFE